MIHEFGHYAVARLFKVKINEFSIGMGPKLFQKKSAKDGMLFSVRALPIGGYVSMLGEEEETDDPGSFSKKNVWQRMAIVVAGAAMNLLLGFILVMIIVGMTGVFNSTKIHSFTENATSNAEGGLEVGDTVLKVGKVRVHTGQELTYEIMNQGFEPIDMTVLRDGEVIVVHNVVFPNIEESGVVFGDYDFYILSYRISNVGDFLKISWYNSVSLVKMVWDSVINLITGRFGITAMSGPIGVTSSVEQTISGSGWNAFQITYYVLYITAVISINLGVMNLLPFPALDGGRFLLLIVEAVTKKKLPDKIEQGINLAGLALLLLLTFFITGKDIISLF